MSADELREAAETAEAEFDAGDLSDTQQVAIYLTLVDLLRASADYSHSLPAPIAARFLTLARLVNGGAA